MVDMDRNCGQGWFEPQAFLPMMMDDTEGGEATGEQPSLSSPLWPHQSIHPSTLTDTPISHAGAPSVTFPDVLTPFQMLK